MDRLKALLKTKRFMAALVGVVLTVVGSPELGPVATEVYCSAVGCA